MSRNELSRDTQYNDTNTHLKDDTIDLPPPPPPPEGPGYSGSEERWIKMTVLMLYLIAIPSRSCTRHRGPPEASGGGGGRLGEGFLKWEDFFFLSFFLWPFIFFFFFLLLGLFLCRR